MPVNPPGGILTGSLHVATAATMAPIAWPLGRYAVSLDFGALPFWILWSAVGAVVAGLGFGRFAVPAISALSVSFTSSLVLRFTPMAGTLPEYLVAIKVIMYMLATAPVFLTVFIRHASKTRRMQAARPSENGGVAQDSKL